MLQKKNRPSVSGKKPKASAKPTGSIAHATAVLVTLSNDIHTVTDIARLCNLGKSTVHRVLKLLEQSRLVIQDTANHRYYLGPLITQLASNPVTTHEYLIMFASDGMKRLSLKSEETVSLDIMIGVNMYSLHEVSSPHDLKVTSNGKMKDTHYSGASAKVMLSLLSDKQLKTVIENISIIPTTERTVTDKAKLLEQILETRRQGYAVSHGERVSGVLCISAPIKYYGLPVALSVIGPESRLESKLPEIIEELKTEASRISRKLARVMGDER